MHFGLVISRFRGIFVCDAKGVGYRRSESCQDSDALIRSLRWHVGSDRERYL